MRSQVTNSKLRRVLRAALVTGLALMFATGNASAGALADLEVEIVPQFKGKPLAFDVVAYKTAAGQDISVTRLDFLVSNFLLRREDTSWLALTNWQAFVSAREGRTRFHLGNIPAGHYVEARFLVGVLPEINHGDPARYPAGHPLNPLVNGLHWGWQGGYVFMALEGNWVNGKQTNGYSFHIANDDLLIRVELPASLELNSSHQLRIALDVAKIFDDQWRTTLTEGGSTTHSRDNDPRAVKLHDNAERAFAIESLMRVPMLVSATNKIQPLVAPTATPYHLVISSLFPRPALPLDNPLTEEGVELGRSLFNDKNLSINSQQSCASCHDLSVAGVDKDRALSLGAEGGTGRRNAMPLFNLAWKNSFFWDGRAATIREQVLAPIQDPVEMHETLTNLVRKLTQAGGNYADRFERAFGSREISANRLARALEQFLLTQVSHNSKFDRVIKGEAKFTEAEQRGFELFHTEYDPLHNQLGADCFHCHGGPLMQNMSFANNGLDATPKDAGRYEVTKKEGDRGKFAVPSLRNVAVTGPYMHDGRFKSLEEVVAHYNSGVKRSATLDPNIAKHPDGGLHLSEDDLRALVAFLKTLTDDKFAAAGSGAAEIK